MFKKLLSVFLFSIPLTLQAYQSMYEKTPVGKIKVIELPERLALEAKTDGTYFDKDNGLFRKLFRYISTNDVAMTTPVEADMNPGKMRFFVGSEDRKKILKPDNTVKIVKMPVRTVLSIGIRGSYSEKNFSTNQKKLTDWIEKNKGFEPAGECYGVYWNGPFIPGFFKRSEVHLPIRKKNSSPTK
jgi:effector-binding domain-containing protein